MHYSKYNRTFAKTAKVLKGKRITEFCRDKLRVSTGNDHTQVGSDRPTLHHPIKLQHNSCESDEALIKVKKKRSLDFVTVSHFKTYASVPVCEC